MTDSMDAHEGVVRLEIYEPWRVWRGYQRSGWELCYSSWLDYDAADDTFEDFQHELLFPYVKPNFDVVLPPARSRKQRGWYQINRHGGMVLSQTHTTIQAPDTTQCTDPSTGTYATAASLPEELLLDIAACLDDLGRTAKLDKHACAMLSRVCSSWARLLQRHVLGVVKVNSREDAEQLLRFVRSPLSRSRHYIATIKALASPSDAPFIHLLPQALRHLKHSSRQIRVSLTGPLCGGAGSTRSIFSDLPRSLPRRCAGGLTALILLDISFRRFQDLQALLLELESLESFIGKYLTWPPHIVQASLTRWGHNKRRVSVELANCTAYWPVVLLSCCSFTREDFEMLCELLEVFERGFRKYNKIQSVEYRWSTRKWGVDIEIRDEDIYTTTRSSTQEWGEALERSLQLFLEVNMRRPGGTSVENLSLTWGVRLRLNDIQHLEWSVIDRLASSRPGLNHVEIKLPSEEVAADIYQFLRTQCKFLVLGEKLRMDDGSPAAAERKRLRHSGGRQTTWMSSALEALSGLSGQQLSPPSK